MPETLTATTHVGITRLAGQIGAELIAATSGLGYLIMQAGDYLNTALVFSGIIMIAILGLALDACLRGLLLLADPSRRR
jgi:NitT/TauT family transport system permease protein/taurine transport system permease protein